MPLLLLSTKKTPGPDGVSKHKDKIAEISQILPENIKRKYTLQHHFTGDPDREIIIRKITDQFLLQPQL